MAKSAKKSRLEKEYRVELWFNPSQTSAIEKAAKDVGIRRKTYLELLIMEQMASKGYLKLKPAK